MLQDSLERWAGMCALAAPHRATEFVSTQMACELLALGAQHHKPWLMVPVLEVRPNLLTASQACA